ncbi:unnamed protein product [Oikopleura dioica]|uniref:CCN TSP1 domain-containing protein n=1 Tax=Oikopleura dioica TaxID=34765 RepID=E4YEX4_OIKDI|nr:unnamed protein product [Oikopleura dioica]
MWSLTLLAATATAQNRDTWWNNFYGNTGNGRIQTVNRPEPIINYVDRIIEEPEPIIRYVDRVITPAPTLPPTTRPPPPPTPSCRWLNWGAWNECTSVCGKNRQSRIRRCDGGDPGVNGCCGGDRNSYKACVNPIREEPCAYWSGWSEWGACSTSCGDGLRRKLRTCLGADILNDDADCPGLPYKKESCTIGTGLGAYRNWGSWSGCSATCGDAIRTRERSHTCNAGQELDAESCTLLACCDPLPWAEWSSCSTSCFMGTRTRSHSWTCNYKADVVQTEACNAGDGNYSLWSAWNVCSQTCVGGSQSRFREHTCGLRDARGLAYELTQTQACGSEGYWSGYTEYSTCSQTCEGGFMSRTRTHTCSRQTERDTATCGYPGGWRQWSEWSGCSTTCFGGQKSRRRTHECSNEIDVEQVPCGDSGDWMAWSAWSGCSRTCLGGERSRSRFHSCGAQAVLGDPSITSAREIQTEACGNVGTYGLWSRWSGCSATCGGGVTSRNRYHQCDGTTDTENAVCNDICCPAWNFWSEWTPCSVSCGRGVQNRGRDNVCTSVAAQAQSRTCYAELPDYPYGEWAQWSSCSKSCRGGSRSRSAEHICNAAGIVDTEACGNPGFWMEWSAWSGCSVTCGVGLKTRTRRDSCGDSYPETETASCDAGPGQYSNWGIWGACNQTCPGGISRRFQQHNCGAEPLVDIQACGAERWGQWTMWSTCSQSCLGGISTRTKTEFCSNEVVQETRDCGTPGSFLNWSPWTVCSQECQGGVSTRQRAHTCDAGIEQESRTCGRPGYYSQWSFWTDCLRGGVKVTCDGGKRSRTRNGYCGFDDEIQEQDCNMAECCDLTPWTAWGTCSVSCGAGYEARHIQDCKGRNVQTDRRTCNIPIVFYDWTEWSACSRDCGPGIKRRTRSGPCTGVEEETARCDNGPCPFYELWSAWSPCDATCGEGARTRQRACRHGQAGIDCIGDAFESAICIPNDPGFTQWTSWTVCSASCDYGFKSRDRTRICTGEVDSETVRCLVDPGNWSPWTAWAGCSVSCGGGETTRQRVHSCSGEAQFQEVSCNTSPGVYLQWGEWSACSRSCAGGNKFRTRQHTCGGEDQVQTINCGSMGVYTNWSEWSSCPRCYDYGEEPVLAFRQRGQTCSEMAEQQDKTCIAPRCAYWSQWGDWGTCSTSCGMGFRERLRRCQGDDADCLNLFGERRETHSCEGGTGRDFFGQWSPCSTTCGTGVQTRTIQNTCTDMVNQEQRACTSNQGFYSEWSMWSSCSASCGGGMQTRRKTHSCGEDDYVQERSCNIASGSYGQWSAWSACPVSCGGGTISRTRYHTCTGEAELQSTTCNQQPCSYYGVWSNWGACSVSCGVGSKSRTRYCIGGSVGSGLCSGDDVTTVDTIACDNGDCCNFLWSDWTGCCNQNGRNVRLRFRGGCTGADHQQEEKPCGTVGVSVEACSMMIQTYQQTGYLAYSYNTTGYTTYQQGTDVITTSASYRTLYTNAGASVNVAGTYQTFNSVSYFTTTNSAYFGSQFISGYFDNNGRFIENDNNKTYFVGGGSYDPNTVYNVGSSFNTNTGSNTYNTEVKVVYLNGSPVTVTGYNNNGVFYTLNPDHIGTLYDGGQFDMSGRWNAYN